MYTKSADGLVKSFPIKRKFNNSNADYHVKPHLGHNKHDIRNK